MKQIIIEDDLEEFQVTSKSGDLIGVVKFNPTDNGIVERYNSVSEELNKLVRIPGESDMEFLERAEKKIKEIIDNVLNQKCSDIFFSVTSPLSVLESGNLYCEAVLDGIATAIEEAAGTRIKRIRTKVNKYAKKYHK